MAKNGKATVLEGEVADTLPEELEESAQVLDGILDADFDDPTKQKLKHKFSGRDNPAYTYYLSIKPHLPDWWHEWQTELDGKNGGPKYKTVHQFAITRSQNPREQYWFESMIGPAPVTCNHREIKKGRRKDNYLKVPWLGDWKSRRQNAYWAPEHPGKIKSLTKALKDKLQGFEAVQSSAPYLVQEMATYMRLSEQIDHVFAGQALDPNKGIGEENKSRFYTYLEMKKAVTRVKLRLLHEWWQAHGMSTNGQPIIFAQVNNMLQQNGLGPVMQGDVSGKDMEAIKLAKMLQLHAENFQMPLPSPEAQKQQPEKAKPTNGKVM